MPERQSRETRPRAVPAFRVDPPAPRDDDQHVERTTKQRQAIREALSRADRPLSPREILDAATRDAPGMSLATVYRTIAALSNAAEIEPVALPGEPARYELAGKGHHHHFHCRACGRAFDVQGCPGPVERLAPKGFVVEGHEVTLFGLCRECAA